jgi:hypothetical protein
MATPMQGNTATGLASDKKGCKRFDYSSLRKDWYTSNSAMTKAVRGCIEGRRALVFRGFPRQWIPVFEWFGVLWEDSIQPPEYIPFFSDLSEDQVVEILCRARRENSLRILVESATMYDPVLSDFLYILDNTLRPLDAVMENDLRELSMQPKRTARRLLLNGWQSYGRPSVRAIEVAMSHVEPRASIAVVLPCALKRPYNESKTHRKIYHILEEKGFEPKELHKIVLTSLGVLPEEVWQMPQVMNYNAGVPDIYRILRLVRTYFKRAQYKRIIDCLHFEPYSDILRIAQREGLIQEIVKIKIPGVRHFYIRP